MNPRTRLIDLLRPIHHALNALPRAAFFMVEAFVPLRESLRRRRASS